MTDFDVNSLIDRYVRPYLDAAQRLRDQGQAAIDALESNPAVRDLLETFRGLFNKPVSEVRQADVDALAGWYAAATAKSKPMVTAPPLPPPPPPPPPMTTFQFGVVLNSDPRGLPDFKPEYKLWKSGADPSKFIVTDGRVGGFEPNALFPPVIVNGEEVGGLWKVVPR